MIDDIECSDEETYFPTGQSFRRLPDTGERIWEPNGPEIVRLYDEIESKGYNDLEWQNPGRISPSLLKATTENETNQTKTTEKKFESNLNQKTAFDDFDFDDPFGGGAGETKLNAKRSQHGQKKTATTNLSKVMANIRRYKDPKGQPIAIKSNKPPSSSSSSSLTTITTPTSSSLPTLSSTSSSAKVDSTTTNTTNNINNTPC